MFLCSQIWCVKIRLLCLSGQVLGIVTRDALMGEQVPESPLDKLGSSL